MRFQAMGDVVITLPYLQSLKMKLPETAFDFLTRREDAGIPGSLTLFNRVIEVRGGRNPKLQFIHLMLLLPRLWLNRYDVVIDLQHHKISRILRRLLSAPAWAEFDRLSPLPAGERTRRAIDLLKLGDVGMDTRFGYQIPDDQIARKLRSRGWTGGRIVVLNPAGAFSSRNWAIENYVSFAREWISQETVQFVIMGLPSLRSKADFLKSELGENLIDLVGVTTPAEAFRIVGKARLTLTEDGGLMHMSWVQGVPTLALFGSSRYDWSRPLGEWSRCLHSSDLPCGNCMLEVCKFGDAHCLTRYSPPQVYALARKLLLDLGA